MKPQFYAIALIAIMLSCNNSTPEIRDNKLEEMNNQDKQLPLVPPSAKEEQNFAADTLVMRADNPVNKSTANGTTQDKQANIDWDKAIIKTAIISLELRDYKTFDNTIHNGLKKFGAYIAQEHQSETDYQIEKEVTIKVPVGQFDNLINTFEGDKIKMVEKNISTEDVTGEMIDTKARLEAKKAMRTKYMELLKQAKNMEEVLQVQKEINNIQEDLESAAGRVEYLQHAATYSTINLKYFQYVNGKTGDDLQPNFFTQLNNAFSESLTIISNLILFIITIWPIVIVTLVIILLLKRKRRIVTQKNV